MIQCFDVVVIGGGPAGMAAAACAGEGGLHVAVVDENPAVGGQIWRQGTQAADSSNVSQGIAGTWRQRLLASGAVHLLGRRVLDQPGPNLLRVEHANGIEDLQYQHLILATGGRERFLPFPGWTLPNVMGAGGLQALVKSGLPIHGKRVVVAGTGPLLLAVAAHLVESGALVEGIFEQASMLSLAGFAFRLLSEPQKLVQGAKYRSRTRRATYRANSWPICAKGNERLQSVLLSDGRKQWEIACDYLACGFHLVPNVELAALLGCNVVNAAVLVDTWQRTSVEQVFCVGESSGIGGLELSLLEGQIAGLVCAGREKEAKWFFAARDKSRRVARHMNAAFALRPELRRLARADTFVCRCEDVTYEAMSRHVSWRSAKLHTRCGMGPCQGRICGPAAEHLFGWEAFSTRPPIYPVAISAFAGAHRASESSESGSKA